MSNNNADCWRRPGKNLDARRADGEKGLETDILGNTCAQGERDSFARCSDINAAIKTKVIHSDNHANTVVCYDIHEFRSGMQRLAPLKDQENDRKGEGEWILSMQFQYRLDSDVTLAQDPAPFSPLLNSLFGPHDVQHLLLLWHSEVLMFLDVLVGRSWDNGYYALWKKCCWGAGGGGATSSSCRVIFER